MQETSKTSYIYHYLPYFCFEMYPRTYPPPRFYAGRFCAGVILEFLIFEIFIFQNFLLPQLLHIPKFFSSKNPPPFSLNPKTPKSLVKNPFFPYKILVLFVFSSFLCIEIPNTFEICVYIMLNFELSHENDISYCLVIRKLKICGYIKFIGL